ncbi:uncharacterized protein UV8b_00583 [Ustilaginoidea virens]|nr:uncharacterized protein UV8b_00583 [Ustilaginoidea virens]QUC16342.1 hypothetical protein UV8b_00583 [Ustilaginoidea virens]
MLPPPSLLVLAFAGLAHSIYAASSTPRGAVNSEPFHRPESISNLSFEEFLAKVSRINKATSPARYRRQDGDVVLGEVHNNPEGNEMLREFHKECRKFRGYRAMSGVCAGKSLMRRSIYCGKPGDSSAKRKATSLYCPEGKKCGLRYAFNYHENYVQWPVCVDTVKVDRPTRRTDPIPGFSADYFASVPGSFDGVPQSPGTRYFHFQMDSYVKNGEAAPYGFFTDTAGHSGWGLTWSCFHCPPGLVKIHSRERALAYAYVD